MTTPKSLGTGIVDIKQALEIVKSIGSDWVIIENDNPVPNGIDDVIRSLAYLKPLL